MNVLLAEDDRMLRSIMIDFLEDLDCEVKAVTNGTEAVEAICERQFDAVFMDCEMPLMDGITATKTVIDRAFRCGVSHPPIIALTGHVDLDDHARCVEAGMVAVLTKPVDIDDLQKILNQFTVEKKVEPWSQA